MCGRFAQPRSSEELGRLFEARPAAELPGDRFNVAPTDPVAAVVQVHGERVVDEFRWGLVPHYAESRRGAARLINARAETVVSSPAFRTAFRRRRAVVPADAFYEWRRHRDVHSGRATRSEPFAIRSVDDRPMAMAAVWAVWRDPDSAERLYTVSVLTTIPNRILAPLHDRMPVILDDEGWRAWLDEDASEEELVGLLRPAPADRLRVYAVSPAVNDVRRDGPELLAPLSRWQPDLWSGGTSPG